MITRYDRDMLLSSGFLPEEVEIFAHAFVPLTGKDQPHVDLNSDTWNRVLKSRYDWFEKRINQNMGLIAIEDEIRNWLRRGRIRTPFDFLKAEYIPPGKSQYYPHVRKKARRRIEAGLPGYFD